MIPVSLRSRIMLSVGIAGHRELDPQVEAAVHQTCRQIFEELGAGLAEEQSKKLSHSLDETGIRVVSPLADGADRIAVHALREAAAALAEKGAALRQEVVAVLPFPPETYVRDFVNEASVDEFHALLSAANVVRIVGDTAERDDQNQRLEAYQRAGRFVLINADLMIVVYDEARAVKKGGTAELYGEAIKRVPVIRIDPTRPTEFAIEGPASGLRELARLLVTLPAPAAPHGHGRRISLFDHSRWEAFERFLAPIYQLPWMVLLELSRFSRPKTRPELGEGVAFPADDPFEPAYREAQELAERYAALYRGAFIINYLGGAGAVSLALHGLLWEERAIPFGVAEITLLFFVVVNFLANWHRLWLRRHIHWRFLAEALRQMRVLYAIGVTPPPPVRALAMMSSDEADHGWLDRHFRNLIRKVGPSRQPLPETAAIELIKSKFVVGQINYHNGRLDRLKGAERLLHLAAGACFVLAFLSCVGHLVALFTHGWFTHLVESWSDWLTFFGAGLPAWGAACHAIAVEGEFGRMVERSETMVRELERAGQRLENDGRGLHGDALRAETFTTARLLLEEVTDWHIVHQRPDFQP